jgi:RNA polymerase sigma-70 factor, ECF subfamily
MTRNAHQAEDLAQDAFLKAWAAMPRFQPGTSFRAWLFRIASNCFLDSRRGPRGVPPHALTAELPGRDPGPVAAVIGQECGTRVEEALTRMPPQFRAALLLRAREELSFAEMAAVLDVSEETARWRVFKARQFLVKELGSYLDRESP